MEAKKIINGNFLAEGVINGLKSQILDVKNRGIEPCFAIILIGDNESSRIYIQRKIKAASELGIKVNLIEKSFCNQDELIKIIQKINADVNIHGVIVQLPLPKNLNTLEILAQIDPKKDIDGLTPFNAGKLVLGFDISQIYHIPCTANGCLHAILSTGIELCGKRCLVINRSNIVGKPLANLLLRRDAVVEIAHSKAENLDDLMKNSDVIIAATGAPGLVIGEKIKSGCILIDVGISRSNAGILGDCDFESCIKVASKITPVPGGIGPLTIAFLMKNIVNAVRMQKEF